MRVIRQLFVHLLIMGISMLVTTVASAEEKVVLTAEGETEAAPPASSEKQTFSEADAGVMVRPFEGPKSQKIHDSVVKALESAGIILIPAGFEEGVQLADEAEPYVEVAKKTGIKAYLHAETSMSKKGWVVQFRVRNGADGAIVAEPKLSAGWLPGLLKKIDVELMGVLEEPLSKTSLPAGASAGDGVEEVSLEPSGGGPVDEPPEPEEHDTDAPSPLDARVGLGAIQRNLSYNSPLGDVYENGLQPHSVTAPTLSLGVNWYPGAHTLGGVLANIGLSASYYRTVGGATEVNAGSTSESFDTTFSELNLGLRGRIALSHGWELGLNGGWGVQSLVMEGDNVTAMGQMLGDPGVVPDLEYTYYRFGPDVAFELGLPIRAGVGYRLIQLSDEDGYFTESRWFPDATSIGLDAHVTFAIAMTEMLDLDVGGEMRYYGINANSGSWQNNLEGFNNYDATSPGLTNAVAAGASDTYLGIVVSAHYTMQGNGR